MTTYNQSTLYFYTIGVISTTKKLKRKYLLRNFVLFLRRKNHPRFIFNIASRTIILSF